jgi:hypothetical protein
MPHAGDTEPNRPTRRVVIILLAILIPAITVIGALVLAMLELNS